MAKSSSHSGKSLKRSMQHRLAAAEEGLIVAEYDVGPLSRAVEALKRQTAWEILLEGENRTWERLVVEKLDPIHQRLEWIEAIVSGYEKLREAGEPGRIDRKAAEAAASYESPLFNPVVAALVNERMAATQSEPDPEVEDLHDPSHPVVVDSPVPPFADTVFRNKSDSSNMPVSLETLKQIWQSAEPDERQDFLEWMRERQQNSNKAVSETT
ncbi:Hypothetical protein PBC10988_11760 [Planctomycetales bacterium 10988]|nr:Hypothetical protein PBC10988_11760 [Planctomycetales bacterium 10988]